MKLFSAFLIGLTLSTSAFALDINEIAGQYKGTCKVTYTKTMYTAVTSYTDEIEAALYVGKFKNVQGDVVDYAYSTEQTSSYGNVPAQLSFLLKANKAGEKYVASIISQGFTGADNDLGLLGATGSRFNYESENSENELKVFDLNSSPCPRDIACNPPELPVCRDARNTKTGKVGFVGCKRYNDVTVVRKLADNKLISERTAEQFGSPVNNYSFYLPAISSVCVWEKQ